MNLRAAAIGLDSVALLAFAVVFLGTVVTGVIPESLTTFKICIALILSACLVHSVRHQGLVTTSVLLVCATAVGWVSEHLGVTYGIVFPRYHYGAGLGIELGGVPWMIPPSWFVFTYSAFSVARLIGGAGLHGRAALALRVFLGAWIMACLDLALEPLATLRGYWVWDGNRPFFETQLLIFAGWIFWGTVCLSIFERVSTGAPEAGGREGILPVGVIIGVATYCTWITAPGRGPEFALLTLSSLGPVVLAAFLRIRSGR